MAQETIEGTQVPGQPKAEGGLPQMNFETFPSQLFWLLLTFGFLLVFLSKSALPRIGGAIENRRQRIVGDLETAEQRRKDAGTALKAYEASMAAARSRALALADESRKVIAVEVDRQKAAADASAQKSLAEAEARIAETRTAATAHVREVASDAAATIVERLIGERVSPADAMRAVEAQRS
jgi:F-type H+-transporting ATPase subunit b